MTYKINKNATADSKKLSSESAGTFQTSIVNLPSDDIVIDLNPVSDSTANNSHNRSECRNTIDQIRLENIDLENIEGGTSDVRSDLESWSGPEVLSDSETWGFSDGSNKSEKDSIHVFDNNAKLEVRDYGNVTIGGDKAKELDVEMDGKSEQVMGESEQVMGESEQVMGESEQVMGESEQVMGESEHVMGESEQTMGKSEQVMGESDQVMRESEQFIRESEPVMGEGGQVIGESEHIMGESEQVIGESDEFRGESEQVIGESDEIRGESEQVTGNSVIEVDCTSEGDEQMRDILEIENIESGGKIDRAKMIGEDVENKVENGADGHEVVNRPGTRKRAKSTTSVFVISINGDDDSQSSETNVTNIRENSRTILEVWSVFATTLGAMPYWISNDGISSIQHTSTLSKISWGLSLILCAFKILTSVHQMISVLTKTVNPIAFMVLGTHPISIIFQLLTIRIAISKSRYLVRANEQLLLLPHGKISYWKSVVVQVVLSIIAFTNILLYIIYNNIVNYDNFGKLNITDIIETLECEGRLTLTWSNDCPHDGNVSPSSILWTVFGFLLTARSIAMQTNVALCIIVSCGTFLLSTLYIKGIEIIDDDDLVQVTPIELGKITTLAEELSKFIGECLLGYLLFHGLSTPMELESMFSGNAWVILSFLLYNSMIIIGLILGSVAALRYNWITDAMTSDENNDRPLTPRPVGSARVREIIRDMLLRKAIGIGFPGLFVLNFKLTFAYLGMIGTLYGIFFEVLSNSNSD